MSQETRLYIPKQRDRYFYDMVIVCQKEDKHTLRVCLPSTFSRHYPVVHPKDVMELHAGVEEVITVGSPLTVAERNKALRHTRNQLTSFGEISKKGQGK